MPQIHGKQLKSDSVTATQAETTTGALSTVEAGDAAAEGSGAGLARRDHQHAVATGGTTNNVAAGDSAAEGSSTNIAREDHAHAVDTTNGSISTVNGGDAAVEGSGTGLSRRDHQHAVATGAAGAIQIGDSVAEGASADLARADHAHSLAAPAAPADVTKAAAATGSATAPARADHKHDVATAAAVDIGTANAEGSSSSLARADHGHAMGSAATSGVLNSKRFAFGVQSNDFTTSAATTDSGDAITKEVMDASASKLAGGSGSASGVVVSGPDNKASLRDATTNDPIEDGSNRQVYARLTLTTNNPTGTWTWDGTTTVLSNDTSGVTVGNFIRMSATSPLFEVTAINANVDVTITNPGGVTIPSGSGVQEIPLTISYFVDIAGSETAHTMGGESVDIVFRESLGLDDAPFGSLQTGQAFSEVLPASHTHLLGDITDITASVAEVNILDGYTGTTGELNEVTDGSDVAKATHHHDAVYAQLATLTTKGDIFVRTASGIVRLAVGADGNVLKAASAQTEGVEWGSAGGSSDTEFQEGVTTQVITGTDTAVTDTLNNTPKTGIGVALFLNGVLQDQGAGKDYTISGSTITWLASTGTAVDMDTSDVLTAVYVG